MPSRLDTTIPRRESQRILVVDDNADAAASLALLLRMLGHEVHIAHSGAEALPLAERIKPQIALLDIGLPGMSGYMLATQIRNEAWGTGVTLIAITAWGSDEDKRKAKIAGFDYHFTKPMDFASLEGILPPISPNTQS